MSDWATNVSEKLAILGGPPVRQRPWPKWPRGSQGAQRNLFDALHSGKWAISGVAERTNSYESLFGAAYAKYVERAFGVPCSSGTAALTIALQTLGVGLGSAVIVPGLTWIACASAVLNLGAVPVLCDVDPETLCVSPYSLDEALGRVENTHVIQMVHMYGSVCNVDGFRHVAEKYGVTLLEDGSQAHGGRWCDRPIGSFGSISAFSLQHSKLLTCGEGGVCVTDDPQLYLRLQEFRADGRIYTGAENSVRTVLGYELEARGTVIGRNLCLSEFQAAVALDALSSLEEETQHRSRTVERLVQYLGEIDGAQITGCPNLVNVRPYYRVSIRLDQHFAGRAPITVTALALARELNADIRSLDRPLDSNPLYRPERHPFVQGLPGFGSALARATKPLPGAHHAFESTITLPHQIFLSSDDDIIEVVQALEKLRRTAEQDPDWHTRLSSSQMLEVQLG